MNAQDQVPPAVDPAVGVPQAANVPPAAPPAAEAMQVDVIDPTQIPHFPGPLPIPVTLGVLLQTGIPEWGPEGVEARNYILQAIDRQNTDQTLKNQYAHLLHDKDQALRDAIARQRGGSMKPQKFTCGTALGWMNFRNSITICRVANEWPEIGRAHV